MHKRKRFVVLVAAMALLMTLAVPVGVSAATDGKVVEEGVTLVRRVALNLRVAERAVRRGIHNLKQVDRLAEIAQNRLERADKALQEGGAGDAHVKTALNKLDEAKAAAERARTLLEEAQAEIDAALRSARPQDGEAQPKRPAPGPSQNQ